MRYPTRDRSRFKVLGSFNHIHEPNQQYVKLTATFNQFVDLGFGARIILFQAEASQYSRLS